MPTIVLSYKTDDETKTDQIYTTAEGKACGFIMKSVDILEQTYKHDVYIEMRDMQAGSESFEEQVHTHLQITTVLFLTSLFMRVQYMTGCVSRKWGVCYVSKGYALGEWTNKEWGLLASDMIDPNHRIPILLDPIGELKAEMKAAMKAGKKECGKLLFDMSSNSVQWLHGGQPCRDPQGIAEQIHKFITGTYDKTEAEAAAKKWASASASAQEPASAPPAPASAAQ